MIEEQIQQQTRPFFTYTGTLGGTYKVWLRNLFFMILTLTIYRAWAKTRMRQYIWDNVEVEGDRLRYTGTGGELFAGYIKVALAFIALSVLVLVVVAVAFGLNELGLGIADGITNILIILLLLFLIPFGKYSSTRYRLSRTTWRSIRGRVVGDAVAFARYGAKRIVLNILSLGFLIPQSDIRLQKRLMDDVYIGSQKASFKENYDGLSAINIITLILAPFTLFISRIWYRAAVTNKKYTNTSFGGVQFHGTYTGGKFAALKITNWVLVIITLGLAIPIAIHRTMKFHAKNVHVSGHVDTTTILQKDATGETWGEGVADDFDSGLDIDFGFI